VPEGAGDLFAFLGVPCSLWLDPESLQRIFHERSRKLHPDRFVAAGSKALGYSQARSALLNKAYRTLKDPVERAAHLLDLERAALGLAASAAAERPVPVELAEEFFEMQEALAEGDTGAVEKIRSRLARIQGENRSALDGLAERWESEKLGPARQQGEAREARSSFARDLEKVLQMRSYLSRMEENVGRSASGGKA